MSLVITVHTGETVALDCLAVSDPRLNQAPSRWTGLQKDNQVTFYFETKVRKRLPELMPHAGLNVTQTVNRSGKIQLMSTKPCDFVRFRWNAPRRQIQMFGWNELYTYGQIEGVFAITDATITGFEETMALTIFRGDWYWDGSKAINFQTAGGA